MIMQLKTWISNHPAKAGTLAGWYQQGCGLIGALVAVPLIIRLLRPEEAGLWFTFLSMLAVLQLTDFGFSLVLSRQVSYSLGARDSRIEGGKDFLHLQPGWQGVSDAYHICRRVFRLLSLLGFLLLVSLYHLALPIGKMASLLGGSTTWAWYMMGATALLQVQAKPHQAILDGMGRVHITRIILGSVQLMAGVGVIGVLLAGGGLVAMAAATLVCWSIHYALLKFSVRLTAQISPRSTGPEAVGLMRRFTRIAIPMGVLSASAFMVLSIQVPLVALLLGPAVVPAYYLAQRMGSVLNQACMQPLFPQLPLFTHEVAARRDGDARRRMIRTIATVCLLTLLANLAFLLFSPRLVDCWIGPGRYLAFPVLLALTGDMLLRNVTGVWGQFVLAAGTNPFAWPTFIAGCITLTAALVLGQSHGVLGIALAAMLAGLCTNYWFCPMHGLRLLRSLRRVTADRTRDGIGFDEQSTNEFDAP